MEGCSGEKGGKASIRLRLLKITCDGIVFAYQELDVREESNDILLRRENEFVSSTKEMKS
jgi:hypothetical protein